MSTTLETTSIADRTNGEYVTFRVGDALMAVAIDQVEEINRQIDLTPVPHAPPCVRGVINLRGEVDTVVDPRVVLGLPPAELTPATRTVVVRSKGERIGLLVDQIADVVNARAEEIDPPPANVGGVAGRFFQGVYKLKTELLTILDIDAVLTAEGGALASGGC
jgi:purine-binding chemotaxis protein CheW